MKKYLKAAMLATVLCSGAGAAPAADVVSESRSVDARAVNVDPDGLITLKKVTVRQSGDTLSIGTVKTTTISIGSKRDLRAELTLPNLRALVSAGIGASEVTGFSGDSLRLALDGAGAVKVNAQYRNVNVKLGGVGGMVVNTGNRQSSASGLGSVRWQ